ncbi:MAG: amino acid permease-associated region [Steroidobacteraceae bacterium]|nr:amino acid permease-associated region [Steroidobacteraceae bacterium]
MLKQLTARKSVAAIHRELESGPKLNRVLDRRALTAVGLGSMIGSGIFVLTGTVASQHTGPAVTLAFLVAAIGCGLAAMCYAELASMIPVSGSAYSYTYATLGEGVAWFVGWNLALEYVMSGAAVAVSWSGYVVNLLAEFGVELPPALTNAPLGKVDSSLHHLGLTGAIVNVPAVLIVVALTWLCYVGVKQSARVNNVMVTIKVLIIVLFIIVGLKYVSTDRWQPYLPANTGQYGQYGLSGVLQGAAIIFFAYIGFDQAATTAQEARNPQRDVPWGIMAALVISTTLYVAMAAIMTGMVSYDQLNVAAPVAVALDAHPELGWLALPVKIGIIVGLTSVILMSLLGQPRIFLAMSRDGLLPPSLQKVHPKHRTPYIGTVVTGLIACFFAGLFPLDILGELISIGILIAFSAVCAGVVVLRHTQPEMPRPFRVPFAKVTGIAGVFVCFAMAYALPHDTWIRLAGWTGIGFAIYFLYGYHHSRLRQ